MPPTWEVAGFELKPFSLFHLLTLQGIKHPLVTEGLPVKPEDLSLAFRICSSSDGIMAIKAKPTLREKWFNARVTISPVYFEMMIKEFTNYVELYSTPPKVWNKTDTLKAGEKSEVIVKKEKIPSVIMMIGFLLRKTSIPERDLWMMPVGKLSWYATALAVVEGADIDILTTQDEDKMDDEMASLIAFQKAELAKIKGNKK